MIPRAHLAHHSPGRTRFKVPSKSWDKEYFLFVTDLLRKLPGVRSVKINPTTASVVVFHDLDVSQVIQWAEEQGAFQTIERLPDLPLSEDFESALQSAGQNLDRDLKNATGGEIDLKTIIAFGYFGFSLVQIRRKSFLPAAWVLAMHGLDTLKQRA